MTGPAKKRKLEENGVVFPPESEATATTFTHDDLRKVIEPFTCEQLSEIVQSASLRHPDVLDAVRSIADQDLSHRKLFIRGIDRETSSEKVRHLFATYGDLTKFVMPIDDVTRKNKGYAFVTYKHTDGALIAFKEPSKLIDGTTIVARLYSTGSMNGITVNPKSSRKVHIGNVPSDMSGEKLLTHFSSYGEVEEGPFMHNKGKTGFAFIVYKNMEGVRACLLDRFTIIDGHQLCSSLSKSRVKAGPVQVQGSGDVVKHEVVNSTNEGFSLGFGGSHLGSHGATASYGGSSQRSHYGLSPGSVRTSSGGYPKNARYSLS